MCVCRKKERNTEIMIAGATQSHYWTMPPKKAVPHSCVNPDCPSTALTVGRGVGDQGSSKMLD